MPVQTNTVKSSKSRAERLEKEFDSNIHFLNSLLDRNNEAKGYQDALLNPDDSNFQHNKELLKNELIRCVYKVKVFYDDFAIEIDSLIGETGRKGFVNQLDGLQGEKRTIEGHVARVLEIEKDVITETGVSIGFLQSYVTGFNNGRAAKSPIINIIKQKL